MSNLECLISRRARTLSARRKPSSCIRDDESISTVSSVSTSNLSPSVDQNKLIDMQAFHCSGLMNNNLAHASSMPVVNKSLTQDLKNRKILKDELRRKVLNPRAPPNQPYHSQHPHAEILMSQQKFHQRQDYHILNFNPLPVFKNRQKEQNRLQPNFIQCIPTTDGPHDLMGCRNAQINLINLPMHKDQSFCDGGLSYPLMKQQHHQQHHYLQRPQQKPEYKHVEKQPSKHDHHNQPNSQLSQKDYQYQQIQHQQQLHQQKHDQNQYQQKHHQIHEHDVDRTQPKNYLTQPNGMIHLSNNSMSTSVPTHGCTVESKEVDTDPDIHVYENLQELRLPSQGLPLLSPTVMKNSRFNTSNVDVSDSACLLHQLLDYNSGEIPEIKPKATRPVRFSMDTMQKKLSYINESLESPGESEKSSSGNTVKGSRLSNNSTDSINVDDKEEDKYNYENINLPGVIDHIFPQLPENTVRAQKEADIMRQSILIEENHRDSRDVITVKSYHSNKLDEILRKAETLKDNEIEKSTSSIIEEKVKEKVKKKVKEKVEETATETVKEKVEVIVEKKRGREKADTPLIQLQYSEEDVTNIPVKVQNEEKLLYDRPSVVSCTTVRKPLLDPRAHALTDAECSPTMQPLRLRCPVSSHSSRSNSGTSIKSLTVKQPALEEDCGLNLKSFTFTFPTCGEDHLQLSENEKSLTSSPGCETGCMPCFITSNTRLLQPIEPIEPPPDQVLDPEWKLSDSEEEELSSYGGNDTTELIKDSDPDSSFVDMIALKLAVFLDEKKDTAGLIGDAATFIVKTVADYQSDSEEEEPEVEPYVPARKRIADDTLLGMLKREDHKRESQNLPPPVTTPVKAPPLKFDDKVVFYEVDYQGSEATSCGATGNRVNGVGRYRKVAPPKYKTLLELAAAKKKDAKLRHRDWNTKRVEKERKDVIDNQPGGEKYKKKSVLQKIILPPKDLNAVNAKFDEELAAYDAAQDISVKSENMEARKKANLLSASGGGKVNKFVESGS